MTPHEHQIIADSFFKTLGNALGLSAALLLTAAIVWLGAWIRRKFKRLRQDTMMGA